MASITSGRVEEARVHSNGNDRPPARIFLQPIAAPSILGLFGFAAATFMVATYLAGWYGDAGTPLYLFPLAAVLGGVAQFTAAMWSYRARDGLATAMHGTWGSFWIAYGILYLLAAVGVLFIPAHGTFPALGFWFLPLAAITVSGAVAALGDSLGLFAVLASLATGAAFLAVGYLTGFGPWLNAGGWVLIASAALAWYVATAMMLEGAFGRVILPLGRWDAAANRPGVRLTDPTAWCPGQPGVRRGQ